MPWTLTLPRSSTHQARPPLPPRSPSGRLVSLHIQFALSGFHPRGPLPAKVRSTAQDIIHRMARMVCTSADKDDDACILQANAIAGRWRAADER